MGQSGSFVTTKSKQRHRLPRIGSSGPEKNRFGPEALPPEASFRREGRFSFPIRRSTHWAVVSGAPFNWPIVMPARY